MSCGGEGEGISWEWGELRSPHSQRILPLPLGSSLAQGELFTQGEGTGEGVQRSSAMVEDG